MSYRQYIKCLLCLSLVCMLMSIALLVACGHMSSQVEISTGKKLLPHMKEDLINHNIETSNITSLLNETDYNIVTRGQWQQTTLFKFCSNQSFTTFEGNHCQELFRHLIYDDNYGIIYCIVPKAGCTKIKVLFLLLQGAYTLDDLLTGKITHKYHLYQVKTLADLTPREREERLRYYYKFMAVRNPMERLVSAYRNKIIRHGNIRDKSFSKLQQNIIREFRSEKNKAKRTFPSFTEFVKYFIAHKSSLDDHFQSSFDLCQPCMIKYDFYAHFEELNKDMDALLQTLKIPRDFYFNDIKIGPSLMPRNNSRRHITSYYYSQLSAELKNKLENELAIDTAMYHSLFPH